VSKREDLISSIVDSIKSTPHCRFDIELIVTSEIDSLAAVLAREPSFGRQAENKKYADEIEHLARQMLLKLKTASEGSVRLLSVLNAYSGSILPQAKNIDFGLVRRFEHMLGSVLESFETGAGAIKDNRLGDYTCDDGAARSCNERED
jgi:hypothetical protein